jgi:hypothetical protein
MEQQFLVVCVLVLLLQEFLSYLVVFPQWIVLDLFNLRIANETRV